MYYVYSRVLSSRIAHEGVGAHSNIFTSVRLSVNLLSTHVGKYKFRDVSIIGK